MRFSGCLTALHSLWIGIVEMRSREVFHSYNPLPLKQDSGGECVSEHRQSVRVFRLDLADPLSRPETPPFVGRDRDHAEALRGLLLHLPVVGIDPSLELLERVFPVSKESQQGS